MTNKKTNTQMLQILIDGQVTIKKELQEVRLDIKKNGERITNLGIYLAELDDDAPTREEFGDHEERLSKLEKQAVS